MITIDGGTGTILYNGTDYKSGSVIQTKSTTKTDTFDTTSTSFTDVTGLSVNITPSSSSNKILITGLVCYGGSDGEPYGYTFNLMRDSTAISIHDAASNRTRATLGTQGFNNGDATMGHSFNFLDSPSTTSQVTYKIQARAENPKTLYVNRGAEADGDAAITSRFVSTITVMEIAA
tara:strand:- start:30 stop:557 length:528 start_codon:yes stop_codon:yes gene_type:complete